MYIDAKIVIRVNECDARKNTNYVDKNLLIFMELCHIVIYNSQWLANYYQKKGFKRGDFPISEKYYDNVLSLPIFQTMTPQNQKKVVKKENLVVKK